MRAVEIPDNSTGRANISAQRHAKTLIYVPDNDWLYAWFRCRIVYMILDEPKNHMAKALDFDVHGCDGQLAYVCKVSINQTKFFTGF